MHVARLLKRKGVVKMGFCVCGGAALSCTFGMAPSMLNVLPVARVMSTMAVASIMDYIPLVNVLPFGLCNAISNPVVAAATAAAMGVLTPMPCIPVLVTPWVPGSQTVMVGGKPALTDASVLNCLWGGVIKIEMAGTVTIQLK